MLFIHLKMLLRDETLWIFLGAMWAPEVKILGAHKKIYEPTMKSGLFQLKFLSSLLYLLNHFLFIHLICKLMKSTLKRVIWWLSADQRLITFKPSIIHVKQMECCKSATVFDFATSLFISFRIIQCHTKSFCTILFYKITTFTVQVTKMDACVLKQ